MNPMTRRLHLVALLLLAAQWGCSDGGAPGEAELGRVEVSIVWPERPEGRLIPIASDAVKVTLSDGSTEVSSITIARPQTKGVLPRISAGSYTLTAVAFPDAATLGVSQASGAVAGVTVTRGEVTAVTVNMTSTVNQFRVLSPQGAVISAPEVVRELEVGGGETLTANAVKPNGDLVNIPPVVWTVAAGEGVVRLEDPPVSRGGAAQWRKRVVAQAVGEATVRATVTEGPGVVRTADVRYRVTAQPPPPTEDPASAPAGTSDIEARVSQAIRNTTSDEAHLFVNVNAFGGPSLTPIGAGTTGNFTVDLDGVRTPLMSAGPANAGEHPLHLALVVDLGDTSPLAQLKAGLLNLVEQKDPDTRIQIFGFGQDVGVIQPWTADPTELETAINGLTQGGPGNQYYEGLLAALQALQGLGDVRGGVLGYTNTLATGDASAVQNAVSVTGPPVYSVVSAQVFSTFQAAQAIAQASAGRALIQNSPSQVSTLLAQNQSELEQVIQIVFPNPTGTVQILLVGVAYPSASGNETFNRQVQLEDF